MERIMDSKSIYVASDHREILSHGTDEFRMSAYVTDVLPGTRLALYYHWHDELEFFYLEEGKVRICIGNKTYHMVPGDIAVIPPGVPHEAYRESEGDIRFYAVLIHMRFLSSMENDVIQSQYIYPLFLGWRGYPELISQSSNGYPEMLDKMKCITKYYQSKCIGYELMIKGCLYILLFYLAADVTDKEQRAGNNYNDKWVRTVLSYVQNHYFEKIRLGDMADQVNMSEGYLCRSMKRVFKVSPMDFLNQYRVSKAAAMIEETEKKFADIAFDVGFCNVNRFTDCFKKTMQCTPMEYRKKVKKSKITETRKGESKHVKDGFGSEKDHV